jgi:hypothetical protein
VGGSDYHIFYIVTTIYSLPLREATECLTATTEKCMYCNHVLTFMQRRPKNCAVLGYYIASSGNFLPTFRDNLSVPSSRVKNPKRKTAEPSQGKEPNKGEELNEAQIDVPWSIWPYLPLIASLGSVRVTFHYTGDLAYANDLNLA